MDEGVEGRGGASIATMADEADGLDPGEVTRQLDAARGGDAAAYGRAFELVHADLRRLASKYLRGERAGHTLQPTALVHEAFLRLGRGDAERAVDRGHFFALAGRAMRQVLVEHARRRGAAKRGGADSPVTLDDRLGVAGRDAEEAGRLDVLAIDQALNRLAELHERQAKVVELRIFGGLTMDEAAEALGVSTPTVQADWLVARRWLAKALARD